MRKIYIFLISILTFGTASLFSVQYTYAQTSPEQFCGDLATTSGCWVCAWSDSLGRCAHTTENTGGLPSANLCRPGYTPTGEDNPTIEQVDQLCADKTFAECGVAPMINACILRAPPEGIRGYFCQSRQCIACDLDPETVMLECPGGVDPPYTSAQQCGELCSAAPPNLLLFCENQGGTCRSSCAANEVAYPNLDFSCEAYSSLPNCCGMPKPIPYLCEDVNKVPQPEVKTAIGCIPFTKPEVLSAFFISWGVRIAGGIAILSFIAAGLLFITSSGDPEKVRTAREIFISAIAGLIMIIFSIFLLRFIGFDVLEIFR